MLDAKIASALNKIIQNSHFKKKVSLKEQKAQKEDRFPRGRQIAFMIYDYFRVTGAHDTVLDYADVFSVTLRDDDVQEFDTRCDEVLLCQRCYCIPKVVRMETGEVIYEKVYASPRPPPKISLKHDWKREFGSEVARRPDGQVARQAKSSKPTQLNPNPNHDRTERPVVCSQSERTMFNEVDIDFRISGLPHSVVKQAENYRVRELVKQIENHPHRQTLQQDLQQITAYNPFSEKSKKMIKDMGNVELIELFETDPKTQCKECLLYWSQGIVYCTCEHLLKESEASRGAIQCTSDLLSIQNYVVKKGRPHWP